MNWWILALGGLALPLVLSGSAKAQSSPRVDGVRELAAAAGLPPEWGDFFAFVSWREAKGNPGAVNDSQSEAAAAEKAFDRNAERFEGCGYPDSAYTFGSGGLFGILPANGLAQIGDTYRCLPPSSVLDPKVALAMAVGMARGLMRWKGYKALPTWINLRVMWGAPGKGGDAAYIAKKRPGYVDDARAVGLSAFWLDRRPPPLPLTGAQVLEILS